MKHFILCFINMLLLVCGQMLFKYAANAREISSVHDMVKLIFNLHMIAAVTLYASATLLWVYILSKVPLSYAYPIQAIAFPLVVTLSFFLFKEPIPLNRWIGVGIIVIGAFVSSV